MTAPLGLRPTELAALYEAMTEVYCSNPMCGAYGTAEAVHDGRGGTFFRCARCHTVMGAQS